MRWPSFYEHLLFYLEVCNDPYLVNILKVDTMLVRDALIETYFVIARDEDDSAPLVYSMWEAVLGIVYTPEPMFLQCRRGGRSFSDAVTQ